MKEKCPQDCQREFPEYKLLISDMERVNLQLIQYADELAKIIHGQAK
jgi:hypothetical protein